MSKVLLVEDDNNLREIYEARMQAEGYDVVIAKDGEEALAVAKATQPDLVISDVMMPKISGFEMLDILRNTDGLKDVKVIMLTALGQSDDQQRADKLGADRYLVKSQVTLEDIVKSSHELLNDDIAVAEAVVTAGITDETATVAAPAPEPPVAPEPVAVEPVAIAPAPEPVAATPVVPEPVVPVVVEAPAVAVEPMAPSPIAETAEPQSAAQEEADIEARIEDFVAGASSDPSPVVASAATDDDVAVSDAADALAVSTPATTSVEPPDAPEPVTSSPVIAAPAEPVQPEPTALEGGAKKVITPLNESQSPDISKLLANEEAKEIAAQPAVPVVVTPAQSVASATTAGPPAVDPNSIAL